MNLFRAIPLPLYQAPDLPVTNAGDPPAPDPVVTDPPATDPPADPPAATDPPAGDPPPDPKAHGNKGAKPWFLTRISEESAEKAREREARLQAERERDEARAVIERLQRGGSDPAPTTQPRGADQDIEARAQELADARLSQQTIGSIVQAGMSKFNDWDHRAEMLAAVGAASPAFVLDVHSVDPIHAHEILHQLADDPDKAGRLAKMDTRSRVAELTRMSMSLNPPPAADPRADPKAPPKQVSRAPTPPPPLDPVASQTVDWRSDKASDADFSRGWEEAQRQKALRGRR